MENFNLNVMDNLFKYIIVFASSMLCMISCVKDIDELANVAPEEVVIAINADIDNTRTYIDDESNGVIRWSENDQLKVIENTTSYSNTSAISIDENGKAQFTVAFAANNNAASYTYNAVFPASSVIEDTKINVEKIKILVNDVQNSSETSFDPQSDVLIAKQIVMDSQPTELNMRFKRLVSIGKITLKNLPEGSKIHQVVFTAGDEDILAGRNYVNATTGEVTRYGYNNSTNTITLNYSNPIATRDIYFTCNPFEMEEGEVFTIVVVCDGTTYTREVTIPDGRSLIFTEGNMASFTVDLGNATVEDNELSTEFNIPFIQWNMTKNDVIEGMANSELLLSDDSTLVYKGTGVEKVIAYSFADDLLEASIAYVPKDKITVADINLLFEEYVHIDEYDGYFNSETLTFANVSLNDDYYCVGWAICEKEKIGSANNKIWYTNGSTTEATIPHTTKNFGANIVSNKYDSDNECWVITFDGDVTAIGDSAFNDCYALQSITIPDSVTSIGDSAFSDCNALQSITIPDSVTSIGTWSFYRCSKLKSVTIGNSVRSIVGDAFYKCVSLAEFKGAYASDDGRCIIINGTLKAFAPSGLTEYTIPNNVTAIGSYVFEGCEVLKSVTIPDSVKKIGYKSFYGCSSLKSVYCKAIIPPSSDSRMFDYNASNRKIYVYEEAVSAYRKAAYWKDYAESIAANGNITDTNTSTIYYTTTDGWVIQPGLPIKSNSYNDGIGEMVVYGELTELPSGTFSGYTSLESITLPDSISKIGYQAFKGCSNLLSITIPDSVTMIDSYALQDCSKLTNITIPNSVKNIGSYAFDGCNSLTSVTIPDSVTSIGTCAFRECNLQEFKGQFASEDGRCLIISGVLNSFASAGLTEYIIPNSVTSIGRDAFYNCSALESITIPDSVTSIGIDAFRNCKVLKSVTIPDSVTEIGQSAFYGCYSLTSMTIPDGITKIGGSAFAECDRLQSVYCKATLPPDGGYGMFDNNASGRKIYVPRASVSAYKSATSWSNYSSYIVGYDF